MRDHRKRCSGRKIRKTRYLPFSFAFKAIGNSPVQADYHCGFSAEITKERCHRFFKLYHELGHIHHQDLINEKEPDEEEQALRKAGKPSEADLAADQFAKSYMGLKNSLNALKEIRKEWEELCSSAACGERAESNRAAKKEVLGRIEAIKLK